LTIGIIITRAVFAGGAIFAIIPRPNLEVAQPLLLH